MALETPLLSSDGMAAFDLESPPADEAIMSPKFSAAMEKREKIFTLMPDSTNAWLYIKDDPDEKRQGCCLTDNGANKLIAIIIIILQICSYILMTRYLIASRDDEFSAREQGCYGPNCKMGQPVCMNLTTGGLMSVLLIGFLWADVVNVLSICVDGMRQKNKCRLLGASFFILAELITAIACGFLVGLYSDDDFDAIGGAVGILFVHDLDEKVFASMQTFRGTSYAVCKKFTVVFLWIGLSISAAAILACKYQDGSYINFSGEYQCRDFEFQCMSDSKCIWAGFVCNGVEDCIDGSDEGDLANCVYGQGLRADGGNLYCPDELPYMCVEDGSCIEENKQCNGVIDCPDGSDEGREVQDCIKVNAARKEICNEQYGDFTVTTNLNDTYYITWSGGFKCQNGQCINAKYACDGVSGDCVDGSDEYPSFVSAASTDGDYSYASCPYDKLISCKSDEILCKIDGQCISKSRQCDGVKDCSDGADEPSSCDYTCKDNVLNGTQFQCGGNIAEVNPGVQLTTFFADDLLSTYTEYQNLMSNINNTNSSLNSTQIQQITDAYELLSASIYVSLDTSQGTVNVNYLFANVSGECIPIQWRCDGIVDCSDGSDEKLCQLVDCSDDEYQCPSSGQCIPNSWLCDGTADCSDGTDEIQSVCDKNGVSIEEITSCGETKSGTLSYGSEKRYQFDASSLHQGPIAFDGCESTADTIMTIYDANDNEIAYNDDSSKCDDTNWLASYVNMSYDDSYSGVYYLSLELYSDDSGSDYEITVICM